MSKTIIYDGHSIECKWHDIQRTYDSHVFFAGCRFWLIKVCDCNTMHSKVDFFHRLIKGIYGKAEKYDTYITWSKIEKRRHDNAFKEYRLRQTSLPEKVVGVCYIYGHNAIGEWAITAEYDYLTPIEYADEIDVSYNETRDLIIKEFPDRTPTRDRLLENLKWLWIANSPKMDNKEIVKSMSHLITIINKKTRNEIKHEVTA